MSAPNLDDKMIVQLTLGELRGVIRAAVRDEIGALKPAEYMTPEQVAEVLGCATESISTYCTRDGLPCVKVGRIRRFVRDDVVAWLEERRTRPRAHAQKHAKSLSNVRPLKRE
jgi:excisionase family DNA binding protein